MEPRISMITLGVADLDRAVDFYRNGLGLPLQDRRYGDIAFFELAGAWLALYPWDYLAADAGVPADGTGFSGTTLVHNVGSREAVDAVLSEAEAAGAEIVRRPDEALWGGYVAYFADLDGHLWEVAWNPFMPRG